MNKTLDLVKALKDEFKNKPQMTFDEFFDKYNIPMKLRTDFEVAALLKQAFLGNVTLYHKN